MLAAAAAAAWLVADRAVGRPLRRLAAGAARWRAGDLSARTGLSGRSEVGKLGLVFDGLAGELQAELARRDMLLRELAHRTMNNLQVLGALLTFQARTVGGDARRELREAAGRVDAMAAAYRSLHGSGGAGAVDLAAVLRELCDGLGSALVGPGGSCRVDARTLLLPAEAAMPLALVANELVTNAIKHGGPGGAVEVLLRPSGALWALTVRNRGALPAGFDPEHADGFGLRMAATMAEGAGGCLRFREAGGWVECTASFKPPSAAGAALPA